MCLLDIPQCVLCLSKQFSYKNEQKYENICKFLAAGPDMWWPLRKRCPSVWVVGVFYGTSTRHSLLCFPHPKDSPLIKIPVN